MLVIKDVQQTIWESVDPNHVTSPIYRPKSAINPLRCLLIFRILGESAESFFSIETPNSSAKNPFGIGPWPCLNRVSDHYLCKTIQIVNYDSKRKDTPGIFECPLCGYTYRYRASSPDKIQVIKHGPIWEKTLQETADEPYMPFSYIVEKFSLSETYLRENVRNLRLKNEDSIKTITSTRSLETKKLKYREDWQSACNNNPNLSVTQLFNKFRRIFDWLQKYDKEWLDCHKPPPKSKIVDWEVRDKEYIQLAKKAVHSLLSHSYPVRLSKQAIFREMGLYRSVDLSKTPFTKEYIESIAESCEDIAIRRLKWAAQELIKEKIVPSRNLLLVRANVDFSWASGLSYLIDEVLEIIPQAITESDTCINEAAVTKDIKLDLNS